MADTADIVVAGGRLSFQGKDYPCTLGKSGCTHDKHEGDGKTPLGRFRLRECWYRDDRLPAPVTQLPLKVIGQDDGWCDDPKSPDYNHHVKLPYDYSHERLWRDDHRYDLVVPIGYNDSAVLSERGSAIFLHVAHEDLTPTEGCVALRRQDLLEVLAGCSPRTWIEIR